MTADLAATGRVRPAPRDVIGAALVAVILALPFAAGGAEPLAWFGLAIVLGLTGLFATRSLPARRTPLPRGAAALLLAGLALAGIGLAQAALAHLPLQASALALPGRVLMLRPGSLSPDASILAAFRIATAMLFLWLVLIAATDPRRARRIALGLVAAVTVQALWALLLLGPMGEGRITAYPGIAVGGFVGRNALATYLGMGLVLGLALLRDRPGALLALGLLTIAAALLATQSRMGIAATGVAATIVLLARPGASRLTSAGLGVALAALALVLGLGLADRAVHLGPDLAMRAELYRQILPMIAARPLTGFGLDSFALAFEIFHRPPLPSDLVWDRAHSTYLTLWSEAGLLAGSLPPLAGLLALALLWRRRAAPLALAALAALILAGLHSLVDFSLELPANLHLLLALVGLGLGPALPAKG